MNATECLQAFIVLQPRESKLKELSLQECESLLTQLLTEPGCELNSLLTHLLSVIERGEIISPNEFLRSMERMTDVRQMELLATHRVLTTTALASVDRLRDPAMSQLVSPELLRTRLNNWQELNAIHRGFTSRLISAKRGPFREPPDLVQFAIDVDAEDSVKYFNAKDPNQFPGKGFFVTRLPEKARSSKILDRRDQRHCFDGCKTTVMNDNY